MSKTTICIKVPKQQGERTIVLTRKLGLFDKSLEIEHDRDMLCIPLVHFPEGNEFTFIKSEIPDYQVESRVFNQKKKVENFIEALDGKVPSHLLANLPKAFDIIGDIATVEVPFELQMYKKPIGEAIIKTHKNVRTVLAKAGAISGTFRLREYTLIAGEQKTQTIHREFGCQYHVDVSKAYFSPRLSNEHMRVASLVQPGEIIVDMFAGVGPFSVLIGKRSPNAKVYAVDINPQAVELLKVNVRVNRVENRVFPILAEARQITATKLKGIADRVIMNLPETAIEFVDAACQTIKPHGGIIHFYAFVRSPDSIEDQERRFSDAVKSLGRKVEDFLYAKSIRETAPYESQVVLDAKIF